MTKGKYSDKDVYVVAMKVPASVYARLSKEAHDSDRAVSLQALHILKQHFAPSDNLIYNI